jgi:hypothetical protein
MRKYLKSKGAGVWDKFVVGSVASKKQSEFAAQKEEKKNNAIALKTIFNGISSSFKKIIGQCTSTKGLWLKLEKSYQDKRQDTEDNPIKNVKKINERKDPPKCCDCNSYKFNDVECSPTNKEEYLAAIEEVCV